MRPRTTWRTAKTHNCIVHQTVTERENTQSVFECYRFTTTTRLSFPYTAKVAHIIPWSTIISSELSCFFMPTFLANFRMLFMYRPISVLNVSCPHAVAHPYLTVVTVTIYSYLKLGYPLSPYYRRHLVSASCAVFLADQFLTCVYVHVLSLPLAIT